MDSQQIEISQEYDTLFEYQKWEKEIPYLQFPKEWKVKIVPPFGGAAIRFFVEVGNDNISVYLDCYNALGCVGEPYWELFPDKNEQTTRILMHDTKDLIYQIQLAINHMKQKQAHKDDNQEINSVDILKMAIPTDQDDTPDKQEIQKMIQYNHNKKG